MSGEGVRTPKYLTALNRLLPEATDAGGYCLGLISALAWQSRHDPPEELMELAVACKSIRRAIDLWSMYELYRLHGKRTPERAAQLVAAAWQRTS